MVRNITEAAVEPNANYCRGLVGEGLNAPR